MIFRSSQISSLLAGLWHKKTFQHRSSGARQAGGVQAPPDLSPGLEQRRQTLRVQLGHDGVLQRRQHGQNWDQQTNQRGRTRSPKQHSLTCHVAGPLVALEVDLPAGLVQVLGRLRLLHLPQLLLRVFAQEINSCTGESHRQLCCPLQAGRRPCSPVPLRAEPSGSCLHFLRFSSHLFLAARVIVVEINYKLIGAV